MKQNKKIGSEVEESQHVIQIHKTKTKHMQIFPLHYFTVKLHILI